MLINWSKTIQANRIRNTKWLSVWWSASSIFKFGHSCVTKLHNTHTHTQHARAFLKARCSTKSPMKHQVVTPTLAQRLHLWPWRSFQMLSLLSENHSHTLLLSSRLCCLVTPRITKHSPDCGICFHTSPISLQFELCHSSFCLFRFSSPLLLFSHLTVSLCVFLACQEHRSVLKKGSWDQDRLEVNALEIKVGLWVS